MSANNLPSVTVDIFTKIVEQQFKEKNFRPIFGLGKGGIGKTESIMDLAKNKLHIGYIDIRLLLYNEVDLKGIPYPNAEHTRTVWLQNNILPTVERDGDTGILVFDEITSCSRSVRTAAYQLLNERRLGEYVLPDNWMVVCLGNGEEDGGDYQGMEGNFVNRCSVFNVVTSVDSWKLWATEHDVDTLVTAFVSFKPTDLHTYKPDSETDMLFASPRSWKAVSDILRKNTFDENDEVLLNRIIANVGQQVGQEFLAFVKFKDKAVDPMDIVAKGQMPKISQREIIFILIQGIVKIVGDEIIKDLETMQALRQETLVHTANGLRWILSLDKKEYAIMGFKDLQSYRNSSSIRRVLANKALHQICPEIMQFAVANAEILK